MRLKGLGHPVFALALAGFGVLSLCTGDFAYVCQPVPPWIVGRPLLAYASGALLLACAGGLLWPRTLRRSSRVLTLYAMASMLLRSLLSAEFLEGGEGCVNPARPRGRVELARAGERRY